MWSTSGKEYENHLNTSNDFTTNRISSSPSSSFSKSSSSSSSSSSFSQAYSPFSISSPVQTPRRRTMEDVWRDINLSSLQNNHHHHHHSSRRVGGGGYYHLSNPSNTQNTLQGINLQEFLARPFNRDTPTIVTPCTTNTIGGDVRRFGSSPPTPPPPPPPSQPLPSSLNLNSSSGGSDQFHYMDNTQDLNNPLFDAFASAVISPFCKKRVSEAEDDSGDHRHKRMIKNRESAARSRARKQAYTNQLEQEILQLTEENARLKEKQKQLDSVAAYAAQLPKKCPLHRTSTAPF